MVGADFECLVSPHEDATCAVCTVQEQLDLPRAPLLPLGGLSTGVVPEQLGSAGTCVHAYG